MELIPLAKSKKTDEKEKEELSSEDSFKMDLFFWLQALVAALITLILLFTFVGRIIGVDGYEPRQGDVVVLTKEFDASDGPIVKRVIAVGGQTVDIDYEAGTVSVDGQVLDEPYINPEEIMAPPSNYEHATHVEVPEGSIFVMGDNRNHSSDSRDVTLGAVDERYVLGRALWIILPFDHFGAIPDGTEG